MRTTTAGRRAPGCCSGRRWAAVVPGAEPQRHGAGDGLGIEDLSRSKVVVDKGTRHSMYFRRDPRRLEPEHQWTNAWRSSIRQDPRYDPFHRVAQRHHADIVAQLEHDGRKQGSLPEPLRHALFARQTPNGRPVALVHPAPANEGILGSMLGFFSMLFACSAALWYYIASNNVDPVPPRKGPRRFDPNLLARDVEALVTAIAPEMAPGLVACAFQVATWGPRAELQNSTAFLTLREFKNQHPLVSWADLAGFVAFVTLREMGAPLSHATYRFGRADEDVPLRAAAMFPVAPPHPGASAAEVRGFFAQFGAPDSEAVALLGGVPEGSLLLGADSSAVWADSSFFAELLAAEKAGTAASVPWAAALLQDPQFRPWVELYAGDTLRWNKHFERGWERVMHCGWDHLRPLPVHLAPRQHGDQTYTHRRELVYGSGHRVMQAPP
eukprot:TRINITY_DN19951_c0_g1_i1.p1 TRINITY_DN19951_c0_g1~~TRINITY_DN19951_c0_g1_i1.p1  ORF type:complete len:462 (+),score=139.13 TRINITY_DN19951_c0_g1_i1:70-1386(+)